MTYQTDGEGYLVNRDDWTPEAAHWLAQQDGITLSDTQMDHIAEARRMYDDLGTVPPIRKFAKARGMAAKDLYKDFHTGPMKLICKWGGLPKPTGCV